MSDSSSRPAAGSLFAGIQTARKRAGSAAIHAIFEGLSRAGRLHPMARPHRHGVAVVRDIPYRHPVDRFHVLDLYRPVAPVGPLPIVLYVHGGGFRILSKDTHWAMALSFARKGYLVASINYRLAPKHPFPAAIEDTCEAWRWVVDAAKELGGDPQRIVLAGESAGGNLVTSLAVATCVRRPEPWAAAVYDLGVRPIAVLPACGMLQVSEPDRLIGKRRMPTIVADRIREVSHAYLPTNFQGDRSLADPLVLLEQLDRTDRPLPPFFSICGTADPLISDTKRLGAALERLGVTHDERYYEGEIHAFHAFLWRQEARRAWRDTFEFLHAQVGPWRAPSTP